MRVSREVFENMISTAVSDLPPKFQEAIDNVAFLVKDRPSPETRQKQGLESNQTLLGLYQGVPLNERSHYTGVPPDRITIYQRPHEHKCRTRDELEASVKETVWHEIAHHLGMEEKRVRRMEISRQNHQSDST